MGHFCVQGMIELLLSSAVSKLVVFKSVKTPTNVLTVALQSIDSSMDMYILHRIDSNGAN
jgi:hypothetical protein